MSVLEAYSVESEIKQAEDLEQKLVTELNRLRGDRKKAKDYKNVDKQLQLVLSRLKSLRSFELLEVGMPVSKKNEPLLGEIVEKRIDGDHEKPQLILFISWGGQVQVPEQPELLQPDEYAIANPVKRGDVVRATFISGKEILIVDELQARGWILADSGVLVPPERWELLDNIDLCNFGLLTHCWMEHANALAALENSDRATLEAALGWVLCHREENDETRIAKLQERLKALEPAFSHQEIEEVAEQKPDSEIVGELQPQQEPQAVEKTENVNTPPEEIQSTSTDSLKLESLPNSPYQLVSIADLSPHPLNPEIYGKNEDRSKLVEMIRSSGWIKPLVINKKGEVISGNGRLYSAQLIGIEKVAVEVRYFDSEEAELEALLLENASRDKTPEQKVREARAWKHIYEAKAKQRKIAAQNNDSAEKLKADQENFPELGEAGQVRDLLAKRVGFGSGRNYDKAEKVVAASDQLMKESPEIANQLLAFLNEHSVHAAYQLIASSESSAPKNWQPAYGEQVQVSLKHPHYGGRIGTVRSSSNSIVAVLAFEGDGEETRNYVYTNLLLPISKASDNNKSDPESTSKTSSNASSELTSKANGDGGYVNYGLKARSGGALLPEQPRNEGFKPEPESEQIVFSSSIETIETSITPVPKSEAVASDVSLSGNVVGITSNKSSVEESAVEDNIDLSVDQAVMEVSEILIKLSPAQIALLMQKTSPSLTDDQLKALSKASTEELRVRWSKNKDESLSA